MVRSPQVLTLLCCAVSVAAAQGRPAAPAARRLMNAKPVGWADTNGWRLVLERTVQPQDGSKAMLGDPQDVALLPDGRILVLDESPDRVLLFDAKGAFIRQIGREGDGPGEYRNPVMAVRGDTVVLFSGARGRATLLTLDGKPVRDFLTDTHHDGPPISVDTRNRLRVTGSRRVPGEPSATQWVYFDLTGKKLDSIAPPVAVAPKIWRANIQGGIATTWVPLAPQTTTAFRNDGAMLFAANDRYEAVLTRTGRDTALVFGRTGVQAERVTAGYRDSLWANLMRNPYLKDVASKNDIPWTYAILNEMTFDGLGNVWASSGHGKALRFDVFTADGRYLGAVPPPFRSFWRSSWQGQRVAVVAEEDDAPVIRVYRIDRRGK